MRRGETFEGLTSTSCGERWGYFFRAVSAASLLISVDMSKTKLINQNQNMSIIIIIIIPSSELREPFGWLKNNAFSKISLLREKYLACLLLPKVF
jgi:hypothetical protein